MYSLGCKLIRVGCVVNFWLLKGVHFVCLEAKANSIKLITRQIFF